MTRIDLNCDLGEALRGTPRWEASLEPGSEADPGDLQLLGCVSSANIACGYHAGNRATMTATCAAARDRGVAVGAHPSYLDPAGMGRRAVEIGRRELADQIFFQLNELDSAARGVGTRMRYVKAHGALYHRIASDREQASGVVEAVLRFARALGEEPLPVVGMPGAQILRAARAEGIRAISEAFADRGYRADGSLVPRTEPGALLTDSGQVSQRAVALATGVEVGTVDGGKIVLAADTICVHGDTPGAATLARAIRDTVEKEGVEIAPFVEEVG